MKWTISDPILEPLIYAQQERDRLYRDSYRDFMALWPEECRKNEFSLSTLQRSPQQAILGAQYRNEITMNAALNLPSLFGSVIHSMLEVYPEGIKERRYGLYLKDIGALIHHCSDLIVPGKRMYLDWKTTSVNSLSYDKTHWEEQLNLGCYLAEGRGWYNENGTLKRSPDIEIDEIYVGALMVDWRVHKAEHQNVHPEGAKAIPIPKWEPERVEEWVRERAELHMRARQGDVPDCTAEERWQRGGWKPYAYTKAGALSKMAATSELFPSEEAALSWAREQGKKVEVRYVGGRNLNCDFYCQVREKCPQYQAMNQGEL